MSNRCPVFEYKEETSLIDFQIWLVQFESYCTTNDLDPESDEEPNVKQMKHSLFTFSSQHMMAHLLTINNYKQNTYKELREIFNTRYFSESASTLILRYQCMRMQPNESLSDYVTRVKPVALALNKNKDNDIIEKLMGEQMVRDDEKFLEMCQTCLAKTQNQLHELIQWHSGRAAKNSIIERTEIKGTCLNNVSNTGVSSSDVQELINQLKLNNVNARSYSNYSGNSSRNNSRRNSNSSQGSNTNSKKNLCRFCGYEWPHRGRCFAAGKKCNYCEGMNHFVKCCPKRIDDDRKKRLNFVGDQEDYDPNGHNKMLQVKPITIYGLTSTPPPIRIIDVNGFRIRHILDSGAAVNALNRKSFSIIKNANTFLRPITENIVAYNSNLPLPVLGKFTANISVLGRSIQADYIVIDSDTADNLLSFQTMKDLNVSLDTLFNTNTSNKVSNNVNLLEPSQLINCIETEEKYKKLYPSLFSNNTGCIPNFYVNLETDPSIIPVKVPPQRIPIKLQLATKAKLDQWVQDGIISPIKPGDKFEWVSSLNPVEKHPNSNKTELSKDDVRLTLNCKNVNKAIIREPTLIFLYNL